MVLEARALLGHLGAQAAELIALTQARVLAEDPTAGIYAELQTF